MKEAAVIPAFPPYDTPPPPTAGSNQLHHTITHKQPGILAEPLCAYCITLVEYLCILWLGN